MKVEEVQCCSQCHEIVIIDGLPEDLEQKFRCSECNECYETYEEAEECCTTDED